MRPKSLRGHRVYGERKAARSIACSLACSDATSRIKRSICILLFNISLCRPQPSTNVTLYIAGAARCAGAAVAAMCLLSSDSRLFPRKCWNLEL
jgi:hypothetical protein